MKNLILLLFVTVCATTLSAQAVNMRYNKVQTALMDNNYQPIESTTKSEYKSGEIIFSNNNIKITQNGQIQTFVITGHRELVDRHEFSATGYGGTWGLSLWRSPEGNILMVTWIEEKVVMVFNISTGFTLNLPFF